MITCYIGIGSNLGERERFIKEAVALLGEVRRVRVLRVSSIYETEPVSAIPQGRYLNGVAEIETELSPRELLHELLAIEERLGRRRSPQCARNAPRTIDLDILYYGDSAVSEGDLVIPHPRIGEREFVLRGLRELGKRST